MEGTDTKELMRFYLRKLNPHRTNSIHEVNFLTKHQTKQFACHLTLRRSYECQYCLLKTDLKVNLHNHISVSHEGKEVNYILGSLLKCYKCEKCDFQTHSLLPLTKHTYNCNLLVPTENNSKSDTQHDGKWLKCDKCSYQSEFKYTLKHHKLDHEEESRWFECDRCSYKAKTKHGLKQHKLTIHAAPVQWFECEHCIFKCRRKGDLKNHELRRHANEVKREGFQCEQCSYSAQTRVLLVQHEATHGTSKKWFNCEQYTYVAKQKRS